MSRNETARHLPLTHLSFHVLLALAEEDRHGYAIVKAVDELSGGVLRPGTGTFYSALHRLRTEGLVAEVDAPHDADRDDARRRYYRLTELGSEVLQAEARRLQTLLRTPALAPEAEPEPVEIAG